MRLARPSIWIPCVLGALALNVLIFVPRASDLAEQRKPPVQAPDFRLDPGPRNDWPIRRSGAPPVSEQFDALERPLEEARVAPADWNWAGAYAAGLVGGTVLRLGTRSYSLFERFALGEIQLYEYGTFRSDGELLHFEPQLSSGERPPLVELTRVRAGSATWLLEPHLVPALFYPPDREDSPFRGQLDAAFVSGGTHLEPPDRPAVPAYYTAERERCARLRLVEFIPEERPGGPPRARFERISGGRPELSEWLWFDGELCTSVRASVSEIESTGVLAVFDLPPGYEIGRLQPGAVFACLPRLE